MEVLNVGASKLMRAVDSLRSTEAMRSSLEEKRLRQRCIASLPLPDSGMEDHPSDSRTGPKVRRRGGSEEATPEMDTWQIFALEAWKGGFEVFY